VNLFTRKASRAHGTASVAVVVQADGASGEDPEQPPQADVSNAGVEIDSMPPPVSGPSPGARVWTDGEADVAPAVGGAEEAATVAHLELTNPASNSTDLADDGATPIVGEAPWSSGPVAFGDAAKLGPHPRGLPAQPWRVSDYVADTVLDGMAAGSIEVRGVSARGHSHRYVGTVRQDSFALGAAGRYFAFAVADGLGSAEWSHVGSATAAREAVKWEQLEFAGEHVAREGSILRMPGLATYVTRAAFERGLTERDVATTLVLAAVPKEPEVDTEGRPFWTVAIFSVGDSGAAIIRDGSWTRVNADAHSADGIASTATDALPFSVKPERVLLKVQPGDVLVLATDGVLNVAAANAEYRDALVALWSEGVPEPAELLRYVDATVKSYDDDRTFVGIRFAG
jgi:serine/threonine protein phosphatase PrpC